MHPKNKHQSRYDLDLLSKALPALKSFVHPNKFGDDSIDFADPKAVKTLNQAILKSFYQIEWDLPEQYLCPPIPGRADYIHHLHDINPKKNLSILDIGVGANCIYPIIGVCEYSWKFVGADINEAAITHAQKIVSLNIGLKENIDFRLQPVSKNIFKNIIRPEDRFDFSMCNPPFHSSLSEAQAGTNRKWKNLGKNIKQPKTLNFGGVGNELWTPGGEKKFLETMISESAEFKHQVTWFSSLVSKSEHLEFLEKKLSQIKVTEFKILDMNLGNKKSRIILWRFN